MTTARHSVQVKCLIVLLGPVMVLGCHRDEQATEPAPTPTPVASAKRHTTLVFPDDLKVEDESVNEFVVQAMDVCASGDYERFRLLWSISEKPLTRDEFEQGWDAVREIRIRAVEQAQIARESGSSDSDHETVYGVFAEVALDPAHQAARHEPERKVMLMFIQEQDLWRLANAPKQLREWLSKKVQLDPSASTGTSVSDDNSNRD